MAYNVMMSPHSNHHVRAAAAKSALIVAFIITTIVMVITFASNNANKAPSDPILRHGHEPQGIEMGTKVRVSYPKHYKVPTRVLDLIEKNKVVGDKLSDIKAGKSTVEEALHGGKQHTDETNEPPMTIDEIIKFCNKFLSEFHQIQMSNKRAKFFEIWEAFYNYAIKTLYPWDRQYLQRMPVRRYDDSIFLSLASYRDENCFNTIRGAYEKSKHPEKLFVGLVQQNCVKNCRSGVLQDLTMVDVEPDEDCHAKFCESDIGREHCAAGRVRALHIDEDESLGPYMARYFASKLWYGEQWFMQIDSHIFFRQDWDALSVQMLQKAPSKKPVLSHYPPPDSYNLEEPAKRPAARLCGPVFASSDLEAQIIRLEGSGVFDRNIIEYPRFAPFTAAGYFVAHSDFLREVPFDPFLPWIFMGEEIIMSARLWTHGYDIFSPTISVLSHIYVRRHKPKFWESVHRVYHPGVHNPLQMLVLNRVKYQLGYPEASKDFIWPKSILSAVDQYTMGTDRSVTDYLTMVGLNMTEKKVTNTRWCESGQPPKGFEQHAHLYNSR
jgi:hypothetical protein